MEPDTSQRQTKERRRGLRWAGSFLTPPLTEPTGTRSAPIPLMTKPTQIPPRGPGCHRYFRSSPSQPQVGMLGWKRKGFSAHKVLDSNEGKKWKISTPRARLGVLMVKVNQLVWGHRKCYD